MSRSIQSDNPSVDWSWPVLLHRSAASTRIHSFSSVCGPTDLRHLLQLPDHASEPLPADWWRNECLIHAIDRQVHFHLDWHCQLCSWHLLFDYHSDFWGQNWLFQRRPRPDWPMLHCWSRCAAESFQWRHIRLARSFSAASLASFSADWSVDASRLWPSHSRILQRRCYLISYRFSPFCRR